LRESVIRFLIQKVNKTYPLLDLINFIVNLLLFIFPLSIFSFDFLFHLKNLSFIIEPFDEHNKRQDKDNENYHKINVKILDDMFF